MHPASYTIRATDSVLSSPRILNVPLLLLANKQDTPTSMSATEIRQDYEVWDHHRRDSARRRYAEEEGEEEERKKRRIASLEVLGVSALEGYVRVADSLSAVERMGCIDKACVRQSTGYSCGSRIVDSEYDSLFPGIQLIFGPRDLGDRGTGRGWRTG